jgi:hypothetical protein
MILVYAQIKDLLQFIENLPSMYFIDSIFYMCCQLLFVLKVMRVRSNSASIFKVTH